MPNGLAMAGKRAAAGMSACLSNEFGTGTLAASDRATKRQREAEAEREARDAESAARVTRQAETPARAPRKIRSRGAHQCRGACRRHVIVAYLVNTYLDTYLSTYLIYLIIYSAYISYDAY